jgi:hypothetical protein
MIIIRNSIAFPPKPGYKRAYEDFAIDYQLQLRKVKKEDY